MQEFLVRACNYQIRGEGIKIIVNVIGVKNNKDFDFKDCYSDLTIDGEKMF